jgi:hypothetical protein
LRIEEERKKVVRMEKPIIWLIDENVDQLKTYSNTLRMALPPGLQINAIPPYPKKEDYETILADPQTACIIIDQKLKETGVATYFGIELARYLRSINTKIPIFILTNFAEEKDEFRGSEWSVENIISKSRWNDLESPEAVIEFARIARRIDVYGDMLEQRERRFNDLLRKSLTGDFGKEEHKELVELGAERAAPILADELNQLTELEEIVAQHKRLMESIKSAPAQEGHDAK